MKLIHIYKVLKKNKDNLIIERKKIGATHEDRFQLTFIKPMLQSIRNIEELNVFESIKIFKNDHPEFYSWNQELYSDSGKNTLSIENDLNAIFNEINSIINILEKVAPQYEDYIISIKLPQYESLDKLPSFYKNLNIMLTPLINYFGDDTLTIYSFENGSKWNDFSVKNKATITLICLMITTGSKFYSNITEIQKNKLEMEKTYQSMQVSSQDDEMLITINKIAEKQLDDKYNEYTNKFIQILEEEEIQINDRGSSDEEIRQVIKRSFKSYQILISEGTEFYGQINSEDEDLKKLVEQLDTSQKLLNHHRDLKFLEEDKVKSLLESTFEEVGTSIEIDDEE